MMRKKKIIVTKMTLKKKIMVTQKILFAWTSRMFYVILIFSFHIPCFYFKYILRQLNMCQTFLHAMWRYSQDHVLQNKSCVESLSCITLMCIYCGKSLRQRHNTWQLFTSSRIRARKHAHNVSNLSVT